MYTVNHIFTSKVACSRQQDVDSALNLYLSEALSDVGVAVEECTLLYILAAKSFDDPYIRRATAVYTELTC